MEASNSLYVLLTVMGLALAGLVGLNIYLMTKNRKSGQEVNQETNIIHQRLDSFADLLNRQLQDNRQQLEQNRQTTEKASMAVYQQVQGFTQGMTQLHEGLKNMHESMKDVVSFQDIFRSPKLRGNWGEASLTATLEQYFPKDLYILQHYFKSGEAVDAALKLPNNLILPIDSKFNWENFQKMVNANNDIHKEEYRKLFFGDVKKKVDEIATKYILPPENTTDFALMYVPAESVYYEMINNIQDVDIPEYARKKKVVLVSPNTFFLSVSAILHWYKDIQLSKKTQDIMKKLQTITADGGKLADGFRKLGNHISNAKSAYDDSEKRLSLMVNRVQKVVQIGADEEEKPQLEEPIA